MNIWWEMARFYCGSSKYLFVSMITLTSLIPTNEFILGSIAVETELRFIFLLKINQRDTIYIDCIAIYKMESILLSFHHCFIYVSMSVMYSMKGLTITIAFYKSSDSNYTWQYNWSWPLFWNIIGVLRFTNCFTFTLWKL